MSFHDDEDDRLMSFSHHREDELKEMLSCLPHDLRRKLGKWFRIVVKEEIELSHKNQATTSKHRAIRAGDSELRNFELTISNIVSPLLTGDHIKGIGDLPVKVTLVDSCTKEEVKSGPVASGRVEIVVLKAEIDGVTRNKFEGILVHPMEGSKSVPVDPLCLKLIQGTALLPIVSFAHKKTWMKNSNLRLQARFVDNFNRVQVKEAQTEPFLLKDRRSEAHKKRLIPSLDDDVWRLSNIDSKGLLARSLIQAGIKTVGDFIVRLFLHPHCLQEIFDGAKHAKSLMLTVKHALNCPAKLKYCSSIHPKTEVLFNVSGEVLGLYLDDQFLSRDILAEHQKEVAKELVNSAFKNWGHVIPVDEDQFVARCSSHLLNKSIFLDGLDLEINESCLFCNVVPDGQDLNPQFLPESLRTCYNEIYHGFDSVFTSNRLEPEPGFGLVGMEVGQENGFRKGWGVLFCVVTLTMRPLPKRGLDDGPAHKKPRLSQ